MALQRSTGIGSRWDFQLGSKSDQVKVADPLGYERNVSDDPTAVVRFCRPRASRAAHCAHNAAPQILHAAHA